MANRQERRQRRKQNKKAQPTVAVTLLAEGQVSVKNNIPDDLQGWRITFALLQAGLVAAAERIEALSPQIVIPQHSGLVAADGRTPLIVN